eukprot:7323017-Alexandrium_andersonii.AAC.1
MRWHAKYSPRVPSRSRTSRTSDWQPRPTHQKLCERRARPDACARNANGSTAAEHGEDAQTTNRRPAART